MKVNNLIPKVYYEESRDFSMIGRLLEIIFNYMKTAADCVDCNYNSQNVSSDILELTAQTIGFESKHKYIKKDLIYIISSFSELVRNKGTKAAISSAIQVLLTSQNINGNFSIEVDKNDKNSLEIIVPEDLTDLVLLEDLFDYILPTGTIYKFTPATIVNNSNTIVTDTSQYLVKPGGKDIDTITDQEVGTIATTAETTEVEKTTARSTINTGVAVNKLDD